VSDGNVYAALYSASEGTDGGVIIRNVVCPTNQTLDANVLVAGTPRNNHSAPAMFMGSDNKATVVWTGHMQRWMRARRQTTAGDWTAWDTVAELGPSLFPNDDPIPTMTYAYDAPMFGATTPRTYVFFRVGSITDGRIWYTSTTDNGATWAAAIQVCNSAQRLYPRAVVNAAGTEATITLAYGVGDTQGRAGRPVRGFRIDNAGAFKHLDGTTFTPSASIEFDDLGVIASETGLPIDVYSIAYHGNNVTLICAVYEATLPDGGDITIKRAVVLPNGTSSVETIKNVGVSGQPATASGPTTAAVHLGTPDVVCMPFFDSTISASHLLGVFQRRTDGSGWDQTVIDEAEIGWWTLRMMRTANDEPCVLAGQSPGPFGMIVQYPSTENSWEMEPHASMKSCQPVAYTPNPSRWTPTVSAAAQAVVDLDFDTVCDATQAESTFDSANKRALANGDSVGLVRTLTAGTD